MATLRQQAALWRPNNSSSKSSNKHLPSTVASLCQPPIAKGNNGRARRRQRRRQQLIAVAALIVVVVVVVVVVTVLATRQGQSTTTTRRHNNNNNNMHMKKKNHASLTERLHLSPFQQQRPDIVTTAEDPIFAKILQADYHLIDIHIDSYSAHSGNHEDPYAGLTAVYCPLDWSIHKNNPSAVPMFRDVVQHSVDCDGQTVHVPFGLAIRTVQEYDRQYNTATNILTLGAAVFHESRCGSTLMSNLLAKYDSARHRVYSESAPPVTVLVNLCGSRQSDNDDDSNCSRQRIRTLLRDTIYLMSRSNDDTEERVFFKFQSATSMQLSIFQSTFPTVPWLFIYRDPVQVMVSQLRVKKPSMANCARRQFRNPPAAVLEQVGGEKGGVAQLTAVQYCAAHLAALTRSAVAALSLPSSRGIPVNYRDLPEAMLDGSLPRLLNLGPPASREELEQTAGQYSKGRGAKAGSFTEDAQLKETAATPAIREAAAEFMEESFQQLEEILQQQSVEEQE